MVETKIYPNIRYKVGAIDLSYILTILLPETYGARFPHQRPVKTAEGYAVVTVPCLTNTNGTGGMYVFTDKVASGSSALSNCYAAALFDATFNPITGVQTAGTPQFTPGPLYTYTSQTPSALRQYGIVATALEFIPELSMINT